MKPDKKPNSFMFFIASLIAFFVWVNFITNVFIFEVNELMIKTFAPSFIWVTEYRVLIFLGIFVLFWAFQGSKRFFMNLFYILVFPVLLVFLFIPLRIFLIGSWFLTTLYINSLINFMRSLKINIIFFLVLSLGLISLNLSKNEFQVISGSILVLFYLFFHYYNRIVSAVNPTSIFSLTPKTLDKIFLSEHVKNALNATAVLELLGNNKKPSNRKAIAKPVEVQHDEKTLKKVNDLLFYYKLMKVLKTGLQHLSKPKYYLPFMVMNYIGTFLTTVFIFTAINYSIYNFNPSMFKFTENIDYFGMFYYCFNTVVINTVDFISPSHIVTRSLFMLQVVFNIMFFIFVCGAFISSFVENRQKGLRWMIEKLEEKIACIENDLNTKNSSVETLVSVVKNLPGATSLTLNEEKIFEKSNQNLTG